MNSIIIISLSIKHIHHDNYDIFKIVRPIIYSSIYLFNLDLFLLLRKVLEVNWKYYALAIRRIIISYVDYYSGCNLSSLKIVKLHTSDTLVFQFLQFVKLLSWLVIIDFKIIAIDFNSTWMLMRLRIRVTVNTKKKNY